MILVHISIFFPFMDTLSIFHIWTHKSIFFKIFDDLLQFLVPSKQHMTLRDSEMSGTAYGHCHRIE